MGSVSYTWARSPQKQWHHPPYEWVQPPRVFLYSHLDVLGSIQSLYCFQAVAGCVFVHTYVSEAAAWRLLCV
jgi:hypothetical protein